MPTKTALAAVVAAVMVVAVRGYATTEILMVLVSVVLGAFWWGSFSGSSVFLWLNPRPRINVDCFHAYRSLDSFLSWSLS